MKWIGQHIYDLVSRFRNDVYLDDIQSGTIASGGNLGLDSNNKIVKATEATGDITSVTAGTNLTGGGSSGDVTINLADASTSAKGAASFASADFGVSSGAVSLSDLVVKQINTDGDFAQGSSHIITMNGGEGIDVTGDGSSTITIAGEDASTSNKGIASFTNGDFTASSGAISLDNTVVKALGSDSGDTTPQSHKVTITGGSGISTSATDDILTISADTIVTASDSVKGIVELATTGEADTGTDTGRAVTPAGLKSHVDTRFTYQYVHFIGNANIATNWAVAGTNGPFTHSYTVDTGTNGSSVGSTSFSAARANQQGFVVPFDSAVLVGFYGMIRNNTANNQGALGLFHSTFATFGAKTTTSTFTLQAYAAADQTGGAGSNYKGQCKAVDLSRSLDLTAGDIIMPAILQATEKAYAQFTIVIKTPII